MNRTAVVVGVRPQYIKCAALLWEIEQIEPAAWNRVVTIDTRQHYSDSVNAAILNDVDLSPDISLSTPPRLSSHDRVANQISELMSELSRGAYSNVIVFGDADPTLVAAVCARKLDLPLAHIEAGERRDHREQEDFNSRVADSAASLKLCVTRRAADNLSSEGLGSGAIVAGDTAWRWFERYSATVAPLHEFHDRVLVTLHRPLNLTIERLTSLCNALDSAGVRCVWIGHPNHPDYLEPLIAAYPRIEYRNPLGFFETMGALNLEPPKNLADCGVGSDGNAS
jgi:UDP-N-acetylglucosamine 2-epimerase (non-hydrolysing)